jgi:cytidylate kinase
VAPLRAASDAIVVDSTSLSVEEVVERIVQEAGRRITTD